MNLELRDWIKRIIAEKGESVKNGFIAMATGFSVNTVRRERNEMKNEGILK